MKSLLNFLFLFFFSISFAQNNEQKIDTIVKDVLDATYTVFNNTLLKKDNNKTYTYINIALGNLTSIDIINAQEIILFYSDFNTIVILDNQLNPKQTITFNNTILFAKKGVVNTVWVFNVDENKLQLYNYKSKRTTLTSQIITNIEPINMESGFNFVKLIGKEKTLIFDQYLNLTDTIIHQKND